MTSDTTDRPFLGIIYILIGMTAFAVMNVFVKKLAGHYDVLQVAFFRSLFLLIPCGLVIAWQQQPQLLRTHNLRSHLERGLIGLSCLLAVFYSFKLLPLADAVAIGFLGPAFATVAAMVLLREKAGWHRWLAIIAGLLGVVIMMQPSAAPLNMAGFIVALVGAVLYGVTMVWVRKLGRTEPALTTVWFFGLFATGTLLFTLPFVWVTPTWFDVLQFALTGLMAFIGQLFITKAYQYAPASIISPFNYSSLIWAVLFGFLFWDEVPTTQILLGALVVVLAGIFTAYHETRALRAL